MSYGSLWERLVRGVRWSWIDPRYRAALPPDLDASVNEAIEACDGDLRAIIPSAIIMSAPYYAEDLERGVVTCPH